jgi:hypothetical protein
MSFHFERLWASQYVSHCEQGLQFLGTTMQVFFRTPAPGDISSHAANMNEPVIFVEDVRIDENMLDRAIVAAQPCLIVTERFVVCQVDQESGSEVLVDIELGDVTTDILLACISEKGQLSPVCPQDHAIWADVMHSDGCVLEEVRQLLLLGGQATPRMAFLHGYLHRSGLELIKP